MDYKEIVESEKRNAGHMFLYVESDKLVAYDLSAFVLKQLFPKLRLFPVKLPGDSSSRLLKMVLPFDWVLENTEYPLSVSDERAEMTSPGIPESVRAAWKRDFEVYKNSILGVNKTCVINKT